MIARTHVRPAVPDDGPVLADINYRGWPIEVQVVPPAPPDVEFFGERRVPGDVLVAVDADGVLLGFAHLARHVPIEKNAHVLHLNALVVDDRFRGRGTGHLLVDAAVAEARRRGVRKLGLRALSTNERARHLYQAHGFVLEGRLREEFRQPDGGYADDLFYARWLDGGPGTDPAVHTAAQLS